MAGLSFFDEREQSQNSRKIFSPEKGYLSSKTSLTVRTVCIPKVCIPENYQKKHTKHTEKNLKKTPHQTLLCLPLKVRVANVVAIHNDLLTQ